MKQLVAILAILSVVAIVLAISQGAFEQIRFRPDPPPVRFTIPD